jgi:hypothetical protein
MQPVVIKILLVAGLSGSERIYGKKRALTALRIRQRVGFVESNK